MVDGELAGRQWRKSNRSNSAGACVEISTLDELVAVRNSKDPEGPVLVLTAEEWRAFMNSLKRGEFDRPEE
jgi:hypothetical protein